MAEHTPGITGQNPVNLGRGIPAMGKQELERVFASWQRFRIDISTRGRSWVGLPASSMVLSSVEEVRKAASR